MTERRSFIKNSLLLSIGASVGVFEGILTQNGSHQSELKNNWEKWVHNMNGKRLSFLQDVSIFENKEHDAPYSKFTLKWGVPMYFEKENVVARPLWKYWDNDSQPVDYSIFFWEKMGGKWSYNRSLHSSDISALNGLFDENTEGVSLVPRFSATKKELHTALGKIQIKTRPIQNSFVSTVELQQNNGILAIKEYKTGLFNNFIC